MKIKYILLLAGIILSCQGRSPRALQELLLQFETELLDEFPDYAAAMDMQNATDILIIPTKEKLKRNLLFCQKYLKAFEEFAPLDDRPDLNEERIEKIEILGGMIKRMTGSRSPFNDPGFYNVYPALSWRISAMKQSADSVSIDLLEKTLMKIPVYFFHAKKNLEDPTIPSTITAIEIQEKTMDFLRTTTVEQIHSLIETKDRTRLQGAQEAAQIAVRDYAIFCKSILVELKKLEQE